METGAKFQLRGPIPMIRDTTTFRTLVIVSWIAGIVCVVIPLVEGGSPSTLRIIFVVGGGLLSGIWSIGLFCYKRWARFLCLLCAVLMLVPFPGDPQSFSWLRRYLWDISVFSGGGLLTMAYFSSVKERFARANTEPSAGGNAA